MTSSDSDKSMPWDCLNLSFDIEKISEAGRDINLKLTSEQIKTIAKALDLVALEVRKATFFLKPIGSKRFSLTGDISFNVTQTCIVSLEPVSETYNEKIETEFWPEDAVERYLASQTEADFDPEDDKEPEQIEAGRVNVGRFVYEFLSTSINAYPRKEGAEFDWQDKNAVDSAEEILSNKPFAALRVLKANGSDDGGEK